ncbi:MAG: transposase [Rhodospirillaceae bacterium]|nr:transposase [Rhodospirillaceae bacterium]
MSRVHRHFLPDQPVHVIQRGNNRQQTFFKPGDAKFYLDLLKEAAATHGLKVHAYVLMTNHVHLLASPLHAESLPKAMRDIGWHYTRHINTTQNRTGGLWEGHYRACLIDTETYFFVCSRYIELNPVRAGLAATPDKYRWSSYRANALGEADANVWPHRLYVDLAPSMAGRADSYRALFDQPLAQDNLDTLRRATQKGQAAGSAAFLDKLERQTGAYLRPRRKPRKNLRSYVPGT